MIDEKLLARIAKKISGDDLVNSLVDRVSFADLKSLLLEVYNKKVKKSVVSTVNQNDIVTTTRNFEVCSDLTNILALECSELRGNILSKERNSIEKVKLCASHRLLRAQPTDNPNAFAHFRLIGLCTAGRDEGKYNFEEESMSEHITYYIKMIESLRLMEYQFESIELEMVLYNQKCLELEQRIISNIDNLNFSIDINYSKLESFNQTYYSNIGFHLYATNSVGEKLFLVDGGLTDWTQRLLSNKKERLMISGIGTERIVHSFLS